MRSLKKELALLVDLYQDTTRFVAMRLEFVSHTGRRLLSGGGVWDMLLDCWATSKALIVLRAQDAWPEDLCPAQVIRMEPSQEEYIAAFGEWLYTHHHGLPQPSALDLLAGNRRGGKTFCAIACVVMAAIACPVRVDARDGAKMKFVGWLVVPGYPEQREIHEDLQTLLGDRRSTAAGTEKRLLEGRPEHRPVESSSWFSYHPNPNNVYRFRNGSEIYLKSANHPESLKQGRVTLAVVNEAQKVEGDSVIHCMGNNIDEGGLTLLCANPPRRIKGQWLLDLYEAYQDGRTVLDGVGQMRMFFFNPDQNTRIQQSARRSFKLLSSIINAKLAQADAEGAWAQIGDKAYPLFVPRAAPEGHVLEAVPPDWEDVTPLVVQAMQLRQDDTPRRPPLQYQHFAGVDFNKVPWMAAGRWKAYRDPKRVSEQHPRGVVVYVKIGEWRTDPDAGDYTSERGFADELQVDAPDGAGWNPEDTLLIADATSQWQNSDERKRGGVELGESGHDRMRQAGWEVHCPTTTKNKQRTRLSNGTKVRFTYYAPPRRLESIDLVNQLWEQRRAFILRSCRHSVEAFKKCEAQRDPIFGHMCDADRYALYRAEMGVNPIRRNGQIQFAQPPSIPQMTQQRAAVRAQQKKKTWM